METQELEAVRSEPSGSTIVWRLTGIALVGSALATAAGTLLFLFGLDLSVRQIHVGAALIAAPSCVFTLALAFVITRRQGRPLAAYLDERPEEAPREMAVHALVRGLNLPLLSASRVIFLQVPAFAGLTSLFMVLANRYYDAGFSLDQLLIALGAVLFVGTGHANIEYFTVSRVLRAAVRRIHNRGIELTHAERRDVIPVGMRRKFLLVAVLAVLIPLLVLGYTVLMKVDQLVLGMGIDSADVLTAPLKGWIMLLIGGSAAVALYLSFGIGQEVIRSTNVMVHAMNRVARNDLNASLTPTTTDEFATLYQGFNRMVKGLRQRERLRDAFGRYVAPELAEEIMRDGARLGGHVVIASVLFADIRGFTALAEQMPPEDVVGLLNGYFAAVEMPIQSHGGWINKFGGDSLLAVFGTPVPLRDHPCSAVKAALGIRQALREFNVAQRENEGPTMRIGMGVHCGPMVAGNLGSPQRMEYTVIGGTVNLASRIESLNKTFETDILISQAIYDACLEREMALVVTPQPPTPVKGLPEAVQVYALEA